MAVCLLVIRVSGKETFERGFEGEGQSRDPWGRHTWPGATARRLGLEQSERGERGTEKVRKGIGLDPVGLVGPDFELRPSLGCIRSHRESLSRKMTSV